MKRLRIPVLPLDLEHRFPELYTRMLQHFKETDEDPDFDTFAFLRAGEWYKFRLNMRYDDMPENCGVVAPKGRSDDLVDAYLKAPPPGAIQPGEIMPMDLLVLPNQYPPFDPTQNHRKEAVAQGKHIICRAKQLTVTVDKRTLNRYDKLKLWHIHNIEGEGKYRFFHVSTDTSSLTFEMYSPRPGGLALFKNKREVILALRSLSFKDSQVVLSPKTADYVRKNPVDFKLEVPTSAEEDLLDVHLSLGIEDTVPIARAPIQDKGPVNLSCNPGTYSVRIFTRYGRYDVVGKITVRADDKGQIVHTLPLNEAEQKQWDDFKPKSILR
jgi:hypothetical protein